jgi:hypothetical protein
MKDYNTIVIPTLLYGCEIWLLKQRDIRRLRTAEMTFMILYHRRNEGILETEVNPVRKKLAQCKQNW